MLESIYVGMTGLLGYSRGLRVIANNTANMNTPGFKSSSLQFTDLFYTGGNLGGSNAGRGENQLGFGLNTAGTTLSFKQGELRPTSNDLDMAVDGQGLFVLRNAEGRTTYTRAGQFKFDANGTLVSRTNGEQVMGTTDGGELMPISLAGNMMSQGRPTSRLKFTGLLNAVPVDNASQSIEGLTVVDSLGQTHALTVRFSGITLQGGTRFNVKVELLEGSTVLTTGQLTFVDGKPAPESSTLSMTYAPPGRPPSQLILEFGSDVSFLSGSTTLKMSSQDGLAPGTLSDAVFDETGRLQMTYSNGQKVQAARIALARFDSPDAVTALGDNQFDIVNKDDWHFGVGTEGGFGKVMSRRVEISNVDLSQEFSDLVIMQRGYQASSQVISTANEMLQQLFSLKGK